MTLKSKKRFTVLAAIALPIAFSMGCANTEQSQAYHGASVTPVTQPQTEVSNSTDSTNHAPIDIEVSDDTIEKFNLVITNDPSLPAHQEVDTIEAQFKLIETLINTEVKSEEISPTVVINQEEATQEHTEYHYDADTIKAAIVQTLPDSVATPETSVFLFGFDKTELSSQVNEDIGQHVAYLLRYPNMNLTITGHTDQHGPKEYNQQLSEKRAQYLASQLINAGVPEHQISISGLADNLPSQVTTTEAGNRRVELHYQNTQLVHNQ